MTKEFVPYEQSLALKELGFDEPCIYYIDKKNNSYIYNFQTHPDEFIEWCGVNVIPTPLYQQAFRWFRDKYGLYSAIDGLEGRLYYKITQTNEYSKEYNTYEEAELACLDKLIEVVKTK